MSQQMVDLDARVILCPCGGRHFEISISNGMDGRTHSMWLTCSKCNVPRVMRKVLKQLESQEKI